MESSRNVTSKTAPQTTAEEIKSPAKLHLETALARTEQELSGNVMQALKHFKLISAAWSMTTRATTALSAFSCCPCLFHRQRLNLESVLCYFYF